MTCTLMRRGLARPAAVRALAAAAVSLGLLLQTAGPVQAQPVCMPRDDLREELHKQFSGSVARGQLPIGQRVPLNRQINLPRASASRTDWSMAIFLDVRNITARDLKIAEHHRGWAMELQSEQRGTEGSKRRQTQSCGTRECV